MTLWIGKLQRYMHEITAAGPWWLAQTNVGRFLEAVALALDGSIDALDQGLRMPQPLRCDPSGLPALSRDRNIRLYPSEPEPSQRYRLSRWLQLHRQRGTHQGEMRNTQPYFLDQPVLPRVRIVHQSGTGVRATWHTLNPDGSYEVYKKEPSNWNWDNHPEWWSRWWAIIYAEGTFLEDGVTQWGDGSTWGGGQQWGGTAAQVFTDLVAMLRDWKSAHSRCAGVAVARDPASFDPTTTSVALGDGTTTLPAGTWGRLVDPATNLPTRLQTAAWIHDMYYQ